MEAKGQVNRMIDVVCGNGSGGRRSMGADYWARELTFALFARNREALLDLRSYTVV
jgi:hypothetical protein